MISKTQLLIHLAAVLSVVGMQAQTLVIDDFNDCDATPQYTVNQLVGSGIVVPVVFGPQECAIEVIGGPGFSVTEIVWPGLDLATFNLQPGSPATGEFTIDFDISEQGDPG